LFNLARLALKNLRLFKKSSISSKDRRDEQKTGGISLPDRFCLLKSGCWVRMWYQEFRKRRRIG
jgi:hypothetical protein